MKTRILLVLAGALLLTTYNNCGTPTQFSSTNDKITALKSDSGATDLANQDVIDNEVVNSDETPSTPTPSVEPVPSDDNHGKKDNPPGQNQADVDDEDTDEDAVTNPDEQVVAACPAQVRKGKVCICHVPPGNPAKRHTIIISENAIKAHFSKHKDFPGSCDQEQ